MQRKANGLTYAEAGVDIDAGNRLVDLIRPAVRATRRPGADGEIGGFGGVFDLKAAGFTDPLLVAIHAEQSAERETHYCDIRLCP